MLVVKLAVFSSLGNHPLLAPVGQLDGAYYLHLAQQVAAGDVWLATPDSFFGRTPPAFFVAPLYVYALALMLKLGGGSLDVVRIIQLLLGTAAVGLVALTARRWYGARAAWFAGALAALCGLFTFYEILILQAALDPFLSALDAYLLTRAVQDGRRASWTTAGAALGLHALNRPNLLIVLAGVATLAAAAALRRRATTHEASGGSQPPLGHAAAFLAAGLIVIAPATARNWRITGELVPISSHGGLNFLIGNGPEADGTWVRVLDLEPSIAGQWSDAEALVSRELGRPATASDVSDFMYARAWSWIRENPPGEAALLARKTWYALSASFLTLNHSFPFYAADVGGPLRLLVVGPALVVPLGLVGLFVARPRQRNGYWLWIAYIPLALSAVIVFFVAARYRLPYQIALCVTAGGGLAWAVESWAAGARRAVAAAGVTAAVLFIVVRWPTGLDDGRAEEQVRMGLHEIQAGNLADGERWIERGLASHGFPGAVHVRTGQAFEAQNRLAEAVGHYRRAVAVDPEDPSPRFTLGRALHHLGRFDQAASELELAREGPQRDAATRLRVLTLTRLDRHGDADRLMTEVELGALTAEQARDFATALVDAGRADLGAEVWQRAAAVGGLASDYERLGLALAVAGRPAEALSAFEEGVRRDARSPSLRLNLAVMLFEAGRRDDALLAAEEAIRLDPGYQRARALIEMLKRAG